MIQWKTQNMKNARTLPSHTRNSCKQCKNRAAVCCGRTAFSSSFLLRHLRTSKATFVSQELRPLLLASEMRSLVAVLPNTASVLRTTSGSDTGKWKKTLGRVGVGEQTRHISSINSWDRLGTLNTTGVIVRATVARSLF